MKKQLARLWHLVANAGQCSGCGGWFPDWPGGICPVCQVTGRR
jgi:rRNA maturation endonuclease Nob1